MMVVNQLAGLVQLREVATAVNKEHFHSLSHTMLELECEIAVASELKNQNPVNHWAVSMPTAFPEGRVNCQPNQKSTLIRVAWPRADMRLHQRTLVCELG